MIHGKLANQNFIARINARSEIKATDKIPLAFSLTKAHFSILIQNNVYVTIRHT